MDDQTLLKQGYSMATIATARAHSDGLVRAAKALGAEPADVIGLWNVPGCPELTCNQLMQVWSSRHAS